MRESQSQVRFVALTDAVMRHEPRTFDELLRRYGIDTSQPYRGHDGGDGVHIYTQIVPAGVAEDGNPSLLETLRRQRC